MAEPHAHSQPIQTYGPAPHNRNIWPHNSQAAVFCLRFCRFFCFGEPSLPTTVIFTRSKFSEIYTQLRILLFPNSIISSYAISLLRFHYRISTLIEEEDQSLKLTLRQHDVLASSFS